MLERELKAERGSAWKWHRVQSSSTEGASGMFERRGRWAATVTKQLEHTMMRFIKNLYRYGAGNYSFPPPSCPYTPSVVFDSFTGCSQDQRTASCIKRNDCLNLCCRNNYSYNVSN